MIPANSTLTFGLIGCGLSGGQTSDKICQHGKSRLSLFTPSKQFNNFSHVQNVQFEFGKSFMLLLLAVRTSTHLQLLLHLKKVTMNTCIHNLSVLSLR